MSHTCRPVVLALWALLTTLGACAPAAPPFDTGGLERVSLQPSGDRPGWERDPADPHRSWRWGSGEVRISIRETDTASRTRGLWIDVDGTAIATPLPNGQAVPLLIVGTRTDGTAPLRRTDGDRLVLALSGSTEHGCPADALELAIDVDREHGRLHLLVAGVPYIMLDAEPVLIAREGGARTAVLPALGQSWSSGGVRTAWGRVGGRAVGVDFRAAPPWLQLQRHGAALELDLDHGCEEPDFEQSFLSIQVPL